MGCGFIDFQDRPPEEFRLELQSGAGVLGGLHEDPITKRLLLKLNQIDTCDYSGKCFFKGTAFAIEVTAAKEDDVRRGRLKT
jgi:hypothetical protein